MDRVPGRAWVYRERAGGGADCGADRVGVSLGPRIPHTELCLGVLGWHCAQHFEYAAEIGGDAEQRALEIIFQRQFSNSTTDFHSQLLIGIFVSEIQSISQATRKP